MFIGTNGILFDKNDRVLMIRRDDIFTWALPGGSLESGELPPDGAAREVYEETGLKVEPERLGGLYFWTSGEKSLLILSFLCKHVGGELRTSDESLQVKFLPIDPLPRMTLSFHRERISHGLASDGRGPYWGRQNSTTWFRFAQEIVMPLSHRWINLRRRLKQQPAYQQPPDWATGAFVIIKDAEGQVLWVKRTDYEVWNLPGGRSEKNEAPWETAVRETREETGLNIKLTALTGIYLKPAENSMIFTFSGQTISGALTKGEEAADFAYYSVGEEPNNSLPKHLSRVSDSLLLNNDPVFRIQSSPSSLI